MDSVLIVNRDAETGYFEHALVTHFQLRPGTKLIYLASVSLAPSGSDMSHQISVHDAESQFSVLLMRVEAGEEVVISRANKPIARLVPYAPNKRVRRLGEAKGLIEIPNDFDQLPDEFTSYLS
jgi:prevent-host-death family protein